MTQTAPRIPDRDSLIEELRAMLGERVSTSSSVLEQHGHGESWHPLQAPDIVCFAQSTDEVASIVRLCAASRTPVIAFGSGTSLEGQVQAVKGGVCIDLSGMNRVVEVNNDDLDCLVEAGVILGFGCWRPTSFASRKAPTMSPECYVCAGRAERR
jgi:D-lactate dehydrogenase (cytochrome)